MNANVPAARLASVSGTALTTLAARAAGFGRVVNGRRRDAMAERMCMALGVDFASHACSASTVKGVNVRGGWFDSRCLWALSRLDDPLFVCLGSGLDTMYERVAARAGRRRFDWIDSDLPDVVGLRRRLMPDDAQRRTLALDIAKDGWLDTIDAPSARPIVFVAEGVFMYLETDALAALFRDIAARYTGCVPVHVVFDWASPAMQRLSRQHPAPGGTADRSSVFRSSLLRARDIARFDPRWHIAAQFDVMRRCGFGPALRSLVHLVSTTRRFMGCAHAVLA